MNIEEAKTIIKDLPRDVPVILRGQPGVGKTDGIGQLAKEESSHMIAKVASTMEVVDMLGIPWAEGPITVYKPLDWAYQLTRPNCPLTIFFLDDLALASEDVQGAFFRICYERMIDNLPIHPNVRIIAASNRLEDKAAVKEMPTPLRNRFIHLNIDSSTEAWLKWATRNEVIPEVQAFIRTKPETLNTFNPNRPDHAFATPRSWTIASKAYKALKEKGHGLGALMQVIFGTVGDGVGALFFEYIKCYDKIDPPEVLLRDPKKSKVPSERDIDLTHAIVASVPSYLREQVKKLDMNKNQVEKTSNLLINGMEYADRIPIREMSVVLMQDICSVIQEAPEEVAVFIAKSGVYSKYHDKAIQAIL